MAKANETSGGQSTPKGATTTRYRVLRRSSEYESDGYDYVGEAEASDAQGAVRHLIQNGKAMAGQAYEVVALRFWTTVTPRMKVTETLVFDDEAPDGLDLTSGDVAEAGQALDPMPEPEEALAEAGATAPE